MDSKLTNGKGKGLENLLQQLKQVSINTNKDLSKLLGINQSVAITCVKPSGTVSQLVDSSSGIHARHNPYYIRTIRADKKDPLAKMMLEAGFPCEPDVTKPEHTLVFSFPVKGPKNGVYRKDMSAIEQLELWKIYQDNWCEHKPSVTVSVQEHEWMNVGSWVWEHFDQMSGVSFLPMTEHSYRQAPYQDCTKEEYDKQMADMPKDVSWAMLSEYEEQDMTIGAQELACSAPTGCEII